MNISHNKIASDKNFFKTIHKFLIYNKVLENLNISNCEIDEKAGEFIGKGLRGNMNLQVLILKNNNLKKSIIEIAKSFNHNIKALCIKELDLQNCQIQCEHITSDFIDMIKSPYTTLKYLNLSHNFIRHESSIKIRDALEINKTIIKLPIDFNPIKYEVG